MQSVSQKLKELRLQNNLTQDKVAKFLKVSRVVYNRYENKGKFRLNYYVNLQIFIA